MSEESTLKTLKVLWLDVKELEVERSTRGGAIGRTKGLHKASLDQYKGSWNRRLSLVLVAHHPCNSTFLRARELDLESSITRLPQVRTFGAGLGGLEGVEARR